MKKSHLHFELKKNLLLFFILHFLSQGVLAQSRDIAEINTGQWSDHKLQKTEFKLGSPPLSFNQLQWLNSISLQQWEQNQLRLTQFRWSTGISKQLSEKTSLLLLAPLQISSDENFPSFRDESFFQTWLATVNLKENVNFTWNYGFIVTDKSNDQRIYPVLGLRLKSEDQIWQYNLGYPTLGITYLGYAQSEVSVLAGRDNSKFYVTEVNTLGFESKYVELELNSISLQYKRKLNQNLNFAVRYGYLFSSELRTLNSSFNEVQQLKNYHNQNFILLSLSFGFSPNN